MTPAVLTFLHDSPFGTAARDIKWVFSTCETVHFIGLCILMGALLIFDLRMLGFAKSVAPKSTLSYTSIAAFGLTLNIVSGFILFSSNPANYWGNWAYRLKMGLVVLALINVAWFEVFERRKVSAMPPGAPMPFDTKIVAALSLLLWTAILVLGRFLPVTSAAGG